MEGNGSTSGSDALAVIKRPHVILRLLSLVFSIVVASCISIHAWEKTTCQFHEDSGACNYGMAVGILSCSTIVIFVIIDFFFDRISDAQIKKMTIFADVVFFGLWAFLWFVCFCYLADSWRQTDSKKVMHGWSGMEASIAFSFFSILSCGAIAGMAYLRYQQGVGAEDFMAGYDDPSMGPSARPTSQSAYSSLPTGKTYGSSSQLPASEYEAADTKPLTSDPAYQSQNY